MVSSCGHPLGIVQSISKIIFKDRHKHLAINMSYSAAGDSTQLVALWLYSHLKVRLLTNLTIMSLGGTGAAGTTCKLHTQRFQLEESNQESCNCEETMITTASPLVHVLCCCWGKAMMQKLFNPGSCTKCLYREWTLAFYTYNYVPNSFWKHIRNRSVIRTASCPGSCLLFSVSWVVLLSSS